MCEPLNHSIKERSDMKTVIAALIALSTVAAVAAPASASPWTKYGVSSGAESK
jgi:hypothetical protein